MSLVAIAGQTFPLRVELESQAAAGTFKSSPTVAAGDVKLLILPATPAGTEAYANSTNAPTVLNGVTAQVVIAAAETTAAGDGGEIIAVWADAAGDEWYSVAVHLQVKAADLPDTGDIPTASANATAAAAAILVTPANKLATGASGIATANVTTWAGDSVNDLVNGEVPANLTSTSGQVIANATKLLPGAGLPAIGSIANILPTLPTDARVYDQVEAALNLYSPVVLSQLDAAVAPLALETTAQAILEDTGTTLPAAIAGISAAGDPWSTALPGAYGAGTAGALLAGIDGNVDAIQAKTDLITAGGSVTVVAPVAAAGDVTVYQGDDYANVDGRALDWSGTTWPDLTAATILFLVRAQTGAAFSKAGTVVSAGGATQTVRVELTDDETALLEAWPAESELRIRATLASGGKATIVDSTLSVIEDVV